MSRISPLFSGSTGNSVYIGTQFGGILVDAGASLKGISEGILACGGSIEEIKAVAVTHEHIDHIKGLKALLNKTGAKLIASQKTAQTLCNIGFVPDKTEIITLDNGKAEINSSLIERFPTMHDCEGSSGYKITLPDGKTVSVCTDLGVVTDEVHSAIKGSSLVLIESNHDIEMLKKGPYPPQLKVRILSQKGHISNNACAAEVAELFKSGSERFVLCHLSQKNNIPMLAKKTSQAALMDLGAVNGEDYILNVAMPSNNGVIVL
ncbi:MAG: MBL fold metallo-hydrolase [Clostridia bacterium]|nr:MBL fold metallo-hydrolase [Clostridia bacterium]